MELEFTQYLRPDGREQQISTDVSPEAGAKSVQILSRGWRFEAEVLTTGEVSLTVHDPEEGEDVAIEVIPNGPEVTKAIERLIEAAILVPPDYAAGKRE